MEKKYYDLIVTLVKEHRKYQGCESILDDIVEDVYLHSKVVLDSITNEDVLLSYFKKVVATSIVTVPKKLNINTRVSKPITDIIQQAQGEFVDEVVVTSNEPVNYEEFLNELSTDDESITIDSNENEIAVSLETEISVNELEEQSVEIVKNDEVDRDLVDKMINSIGPQANAVDNLQVEEDEMPISEVLVGDVLTPSNEGSDYNVSKDSSAEEFLDFVDSSIDQEVDTSFDNQMISKDIDNENNSEMLEETINSPIEEVEDILEEAVPIESPDEEILVADGEDVSVENLEYVDTNTNLEIFDDDLGQVDGQYALDDEGLTEDSVDLSESISEESDNLELGEESLEDLDEALEITIEQEYFEEQDELLEVDSEVAVSISEEKDLLEGIESTDEVIIEDSYNSEFIPPSYKCFDFEPESDVYDLEEIMSDLDRIEQKYPEKQILNICNLKYNEKMSIPEISSSLGMTEEEVILVLNEIIETVKD